MKFPQLFAKASEELPDVVSLFGNSVTRQVWGNLMSDAICHMLSGIWHEKSPRLFMAFFEKKIIPGEIWCQMPDNYICKIWHRTGIFPFDLRACLLSFWKGEIISQWPVNNKVLVLINTSNVIFYENFIQCPSN